MPDETLTPLTPEQLARWRTVLTPLVGPAALLLPAEDIERLRQRIQEGANQFLQSCFTAPRPSLCDTCTQAYNLAGGSVSIGSQTFLQRYCNARPGSIHAGGFDACEFFHAKPTDVALSDKVHGTLADWLKNNPKAKVGIKGQDTDNL